MSKKKKKRTNKKSVNQAKTQKSSAQKTEPESASDTSKNADIANPEAEQRKEKLLQSQLDKKKSEPQKNLTSEEAEENPTVKATKAFDGPKKLPVPKRKTAKSKTKPASKAKSSENPDKKTTGNSPFIVVPEKSEDKIDAGQKENKPVAERTKKPTAPPPSEKPKNISSQKKELSKPQKTSEPEHTKKSSKANKNEKTATTQSKIKEPASTSKKTGELTESPDSSQLDKLSKQDREKIDTKNDASKVLAALDKIEDTQKQDDKETPEKQVTSETINNSSSKETDSPAILVDKENVEKTSQADNIDTTSQALSKKDKPKEDATSPETTLEEEKTTKKSISIAPAPDESKDATSKKTGTIDAEQETLIDLDKESPDEQSNKQDVSTDADNQEDQEDLADSEETLEKATGSKKLQHLQSKFQNSSPRRRYLLTTAAVILGFYVVLTSAWAFDSARHSGRAARGTHIGDVNVSGMQEADVQKETEKFAAQLDEKTITLKADEASVEVSPKQLGAEVDTEALTAAAFENSSNAVLPVRPVKWLGNVFSSKSVITPEYNIDEDKLIALTDELLGSQIDGPKEPGIALINNKLDATPGESGKEVVTTNLLRDVEAAISQGKPATIDLPTTVAEPKVTLETAKELASEADKVTDEPIALTALDQRIQISPKTLKKWIAVAEVDEKQTWIIDQELATDELNNLFGELGVTENPEEAEKTDDGSKEPLTPKFTVVNNKPILLPVADTITCCDDNTASAIKDILLSEPQSPEEIVFPEYETMADQCKKSTTRGNVETSEETIRQGNIDIDFLTNDPEYEKLNSYGIVEEISTCTTAHTGGNRSVNIKNFAATMNGKIIEPQSQISLNEEVGQRTRAKGYLPAGAINGGSSTNDEVGGGISQFATTFFNASFFGGLDLIAFKPHSQYFSRYPYALESTISWGGPEVISGNPTDKGVLVWTEFTNSSVTVTFYSTKSVEVEASAPKRWTRGICQMGSIERTINGEKDSKEVVAEYRKDGFDCNGNPSAAKQKELAEQAAAQQPQPVTTPAPPQTPNPNPPANPFFEN